MSNGQPSAPDIKGAGLSDSWLLVEEHFRTGKEKLVVIAFVHFWSSPSLHVIASLSRIKSEVSFARVFAINADNEPAKCREFRLRSTPSVCFYYDGKPLTVRRPDWEDQQFFVGAMPEDNWLDLIRHARDAGERGKLIVYADF